MALKLKTRTQFPAVVSASSPVTVTKVGVSYTFGFDVTALRTALDPYYAVVNLNSLILNGATSGTTTVQAPAIAGSAVVTMPGVTGTLATLAGTEALTNKTLTTPVVTFATGANSQITAGSANTGFQNQLSVSNSGTSSNASTQAAVTATLGIANSYVGMFSTGGASPAGSITSGTALTGGLSIAAGAGTLFLASPNLITPVLGVATGTSLAVTGAITSSGTAGIGYATGAGSAITQGTSRATGVTLSKLSGAITLFAAVNAAVSAATAVTITVTNTTVAATDTIIINQKSGTDKYLVFVTAVAAGSFAITWYTTGGTTNESPVFNFNVVKGVAA